MADSAWHSLEDAVASLAADAVLIQKLLDAAYSRQQEQFLRILSTAPFEVRDILLPLCPRPQTLASHQVRCQVRVGVTHSAGGGIVVSPINLGFKGLYETTRQEECSITVLVTASPQTPAARNRR